MKHNFLKRCHLLVIVSLLLPNLVACTLKSAKTGGDDIEYRGDSSTSKTADGVSATNYDAIDYDTGAPEGYPIYTYVLISRADERAIAVISEILRTTTSLKESKLDKDNINLLMIPAKQSKQMRSVFKDARVLHRKAATAIVHTFYDYGYAELLLSQACKAPELKSHCDASGPFLLTVEAPLDRQTVPAKILLTNLSTTHTDAIPEVIADYKKQVKKPDAFTESLTDSWRLAALNAILNVADYAPMITKAYADYTK